MTFKRISFLGLQIDINGSVSDIVQMMKDHSAPHFVNIIGPEAWSLARVKPSYPEEISSMTLNLPDGSGVAYICHLLTKESCRSFSFDMTAFARDFFNALIQQNLSVALVGGQPRDDEDVHTKLSEKFPGINIVQTVHGYGDFTQKVANILSKSPQVIIVSMDPIRQVEFLQALHEAGFKGFALGCGQFVQNYATIHDHHDFPDWMGRYRLASLFKLYKNPSRLWQRYFYGYKDFVILACRQLFMR